MKCEYCNREHLGSYGSGRFCSNKCAKGFSTKNNRKEIWSKISKSLKDKHRNDPSIMVKIKLSMLKTYADRREQIINLWLEGKYSGTTDNLLEYIRIYLRKINNDRCSKCGWSEKNISSNIVPLEIHHKDNDRKNNSKDNVELLCPNCHSLTEKFGFHGRHTKRKYIFRQ